MRQLAAAIGLTLALALALGQIANADGIDRTYVVGDEPMAMAVDSSDGRIYVGRTGGGSDRLVVIDPQTRQTTTYNTTGSPRYLAIDSVHRRLYVANSGGPVEVFDLTTMTVEATLPIGGTGIAVDPATQRVYVAGATALWVVDGATNTVVQSRAASPDESWIAVAIDPLMHQVYVTNIFAWIDASGQPIYRSLVVLDDQDLSVLKDIRTDLYVRWGIAVDHARHRVYLADNSGSTSSVVAAIDTSSLILVNSVSLTGATGGVALLPDGVYVTAIGVGYYVLDPDTLAVRRGVSTQPFQPLLLVLHPAGDLYVGGRQSGPDVVAAISFGNHAPAINGAFLSPDPPTTSDKLVLSVYAMDGDFGVLPSGQRDPLTSTYEWARNGVILSGETSSTLDLARSGNGDRGDTVTAYVTVRDPQGLTASASRSVIIVNAAPEPSVSLSSLSPGTNDVLTATATASDADGDPVTFAYQWSRNGVVIAGATASSLDLATYGDDGDVIDVLVTASDDHGGTATATGKALVSPTSGTFLYLRSEPGDYIGQGALQLNTSANSKIWGYAGGGSFSARIVQGTLHNWSMHLDAPYGQVLAVGPYAGAVRSAGPTAPPTMDFSGDGRGCNTLTGRFDVTQLEYNIYGELKLIDATFEQHCEGAIPALFGRIRLEVPPPIPGVVLPRGTLTPPTSGNYLYVYTETDYSGGTYESLYTSAGSVITGALKGGGDYFRGSVVQGNYAQWWSVDIASPPGTALVAGSYIRAMRAPFREAGRPGLDVSGNGTGCNALTGKFDVDELTFAPTGELLIFQATFQQYCDNSPLARYGRIRVEAPAPRSPITLPTGSITPPASGNFLYVNSQPGDFAGQGLESLFVPADSTISGSLSGAGDYVNGWVYQALGGGYARFWYVRIAAPPGQALAVGSYIGAARADFRQSGEPGLEVTGSGGHCGTVLGRFDVQEISFWPNGEVRTFQATFEQHCNYSTAAMFGRFRLETSPPLQLGVTIREEGSVTGKTIIATIEGTVSCSRSATVDVTITLTQVQTKGVTVTGTVTVPINCTAPSVAWSQSVWPQTGAFKAGSGTATISATACEPDRKCVSATATRTVKLNLGK